MQNKIIVKKLWHEILKGIWKNSTEKSMEYSCKYCGILELRRNKKRNVCFNCKIKNRAIYNKKRYQGAIKSL